MAKTKSKVEGNMELGDLVRDTITGYEGIYVAYSRWLTGCDRVTIEPVELSKEGKPRELVTFDISRIELVKKGVAKLSAQRVDPPASVRDTGGPMPELTQGR